MTEEGNSTSSLSTLAVVVGIIASISGVILGFGGQESIQNVLKSWVGVIISVYLISFVFALILYYPVRLIAYAALRKYSIKKFAVTITNPSIKLGQSVYFEIQLETHFNLSSGFIVLRINDPYGKERKVQVYTQDEPKLKGNITAFNGKLKAKWNSTGIDLDSLEEEYTTKVQLCDVRPDEWQFFKSRIYVMKKQTVTFKVRK